MPGKLREIKTAPKARPALLKRKLAGAALVGLLSVSCAPETIQVTAKSPIRITAAQPRAEEPKNPRWGAFSEKYSLTDKEMSLIEDIFTLEQDKTGFWPSEVFDVLMGNSTLRKNHLEKSCRLVSSVLNRTDSLDDAINALGTLEYLFKGQKVGSTELDIVMQLVEGGPKLGQDERRTLYNTSAIFRSDSYSPEFLKQMQLFLNNGGVLGGYVTREEKMFVLNAFHALSTRGSDHSETFAATNEVLELFSERVRQLAEKNRKRFEELFRGTALPNGFTPVFMYGGATKKDAARVILSSFMNPHFSQPMFDDLVSELETVINSDYAGSSTAKSALKALAEIYKMDFFDSGASSKLKASLKKLSSAYAYPEKFLESALLISKSRDFRSFYGSCLFVEMLGDLEEIVSMLTKKNAEYHLPDAANALATQKYYSEMLKTLKILIKYGGGAEISLGALSQISQSKDLSPKLIGVFEGIAKKASRIRGDEGGYAFLNLSRLLSQSKNHMISINNLSFVLGQKGGQAGPLFSLFANLAEKGLLVDDAQFLAKFGEAKTLAKEAGARYKDPEVCLNFAYAVETVGKDKALTLHKSYGLEYFGRYPKELLEELLRSEHPRHRKLSPVAFVVYNKSDWNGAFYSQANNLEYVMKTHKMFVIEVNSDKDIPKKMEESISFHKTRFGSYFLGAKISLLIVGGHGSPHGISLGGYSGSRSYISSSDMGMFRKIREHFVDNPTVILVSCSTGRSEHAIGARISKALGARLFAPKKDGNISSIKVGPTGEILDVDYNVPSNEFESGKIKREEGNE